jgi:hypothetical protein
MEKRWHGNENRWGNRFRVNIPIQIQISANALTGADGCIKNLSLSGALVKADVDLRLHALINVSIKMPLQRAAAIFAPIVVKDLLRSPSIPLPS